MNEGWGKLSDIAMANRVMRSEDADGVVELFVPVDGVLLCRMKGVFTHSHALELSRVSSTIDAPVLHYFSDWEFMESYESDARVTMVDWGRHERKRLKTGTFICGNRIVEMGVTVAGLAMTLLGVEIKATTRDDFNAKLAQRCLANK